MADGIQIGFQRVKETGLPQNNFFLCSVTGLHAVQLPFHQSKFVS